MVGVCLYKARENRVCPPERYVSFGGSLPDRFGSWHSTCCYAAAKLLTKKDFGVLSLVRSKKGDVSDLDVDFGVGTAIPVATPEGDFLGKSMPAKRSCVYLGCGQWEYRCVNPRTSRWNSWLRFLATRCCRQRVFGGGIVVFSQNFLSFF